MDTATEVGKPQSNTTSWIETRRAEDERKARRKARMLLSEEELAKLDVPTRRTLLHYEAVEFARSNEYAHEIYWMTRHELEGGKTEKFCSRLIRACDSGITGDHCNCRHLGIAASIGALEKQ